MSEENGSEEAEGDLAAGLEQKKTSGKKIIIIVGAALLVLLLGGGTAYFLMSGGDEAHEQATDLDGGGQASEVNPEEPTELLFLELDPLLVNLDTAGGKPKYLKLTISLEVDRQTSLDDLNKKMPRIIDQFQTYLRQLRIEDLNGSAGMFRLKEELLVKVNEAVYPTRVNDVLFKEMLVNG
ncbi:flagellar basal body-associated FliL family protein [Paremcibacter congregatus]|uniref:Flagellar protein FliL n=1 Tax=Paremcibacter congregatus TaxID=2043170 RepID=A0A2G4YLZ6_9PROT|nr:flagellar basal body-associated FliL family protein [Paremcibacter congregatus]PHZ83343.1 flagellar basal body protein FliL [Paremcibacter congregatus]QDE28185.1 flagellar basal body protein FliL [Paremcibacter congregatus]|tara:strand:+ start:893 stop:1435 length:543 start_codon:yes stop_codon:yes gene_type:complete